MELSDLKKGRRSAIARAITIIENDPKQARVLIKEIYGQTGKSSIIGITGPAGAGKSSLINKTVLALKKLRTNPAVLAVDPTSHITGGSILGDRVRMTESTDSGAYIRSIASRGATGAVSHSLRNSIRVLEYAGFDPIIIESVGAGQTEVEISNIADIVTVVFNPHTGDSIQTIKAGLTEIGDIYLVNKSDLSGADRLYDSVRDFIGDSGPKPAILKTSVVDDSGITEFARVLKEMMADKKRVRKVDEKLKAELKDIVLSNIQEMVDDMIDSTGYLEELRSKSIDPFEAGDKLTKSILKGGAK